MSSQNPHPPTVGLIGFGAFGQLVARSLAPHVRLSVHDPVWPAEAAATLGLHPSSFAAAAACRIVILAVPVSCLGAVAAAAAPHLRADALVLDVGSVKVAPARVLLAALPPHVDILVTHPLFGPQSAKAGLTGHKIVLCPVRCARLGVVTRFLGRALGLEVIVTTPEEHDRELATVQGLTHLVGRIVGRMGPLPTRLTTRSYDRLMEAVAMVVDDAPAVFDAILRDNPHAPTVRSAFFGAAAKLEAELSGRAP